MYETRFANRPGERGQHDRTTMRLATTGLTLAGAAAFCLPYLLPAAALDAALASAGLPTGEIPRLLAFAYMPAALGALGTGIRLRADGAGGPRSAVAAGLVALAGMLWLASALFPAGGALAHLSASSATGLLVLSLHGLGLCLLCVPPEAAHAPADAPASVHPLPVARPRPVAQAGETDGPGVALAA